MHSHNEPLGVQVSIRELRIAHGLTLVQLAQRIADQGVIVGPEAISNVELGRKRASSKLLVAWAKALRVNPLDVRQGPIRGEFFREPDTPDEPVVVRSKVPRR